MSSTSKRTLAFGVAGAIALGLAAAAPAQPGDVPVYANGHCDLCADYEAGEQEIDLHYHFHETSPGHDEAGNPLVGEYEPSLLNTRVSDALVATVPESPIYAFLGAPAGADVWILPQGESTVVPFLGFGTEELDPDDWSTGITYALIGASGPGEFSMWMTPPLGDPWVYWATSDGIDSSDVYVQATLGHSHANWGFTAKGVYDVQMQISGTLADGTTVVSSEIETFKFLVGSDTVADPGPGDANADGFVDDEDASILGANWLSTDANWWRGDFNGDHFVNDADAAILAAHWGDGAAQESHAVPEPRGGVALAAGGVVLALVWPRRRKRTARLALLSVAAVLFMASARTVLADAPPVFATGAIHLGLKYEGDELLLQYHVPYAVTAEDGVTALQGRYDADALLTRVPDASKTTLTASQATQLSFLGDLSEGDDVWVLPQVQDYAMPFMGFGSGLTGSDWQSTEVALKHVDFSGPGEFGLWTTDGFGVPTATPWTTSDGLDDSDVYGLAVQGGHTHANWGFTEEGIYQLTVEASCTLVGGVVKTDTETFTFLVGSNTVPEPGTVALVCSAAVMLLFTLRPRRRRAG